MVVETHTSSCPSDTNSSPCTLCQVCDLGRAAPMPGTAKGKKAKGAVGMGGVLAPCLHEAGAEASFLR